MKKPPDLTANAPWKVRFRAPALWNSTIAPLAPARGLLASNRSGTLQWYAWDVPSGALRQLTHTAGGHGTWLTLAPDGRFVYYLQDKQGNEIGHYVRLPYEATQDTQATQATQASQGSEPEDLTPDLPAYSSMVITASRNGSRLAFIAAYDNRFHVYCLEHQPDGAPGEPRLLYSSGNFVRGVALAPDGDLVVVASSERTGRLEFDLLAFDTTSGAQVGALSDGEGGSLGISLPSPVPGDSRFLATTTRSGIERMVIWDARTGMRTDLELPEAPGAAVPQDWSPDGRRLLFSTVHQAETRLYLHELAGERAGGATHRLDYGSGTAGPAYFLPEGEGILAHWQDVANPSRLVALDPQSGAIGRTVLAAGEVPPGHGWRSISFPSSDGQMVHAWLGVPDGTGPFPTILETHGGPTAVQTNVFAPAAQAWLDHGFAFCSVNYRGSITFGREFERQIWGNPGHWELEDMAAAREWLVDQGIAHPDAILLSGWSYGGYLTLLGLGRQPALWAGGMAGIAIADWEALYADEAESLRGYQRALFGGSPEETPEQHRTSSPITYAADVQAPILIIQGRNDTRTPARQVELYESRLRALGKDITVHWFETGHAGSRTDVETAVYNTELMLRFAYRVLG